ncbi:hypothetical protein CAOG_07054 [Capsaspora owczarzaki ATCC 30864]|uniref:Uncharacterized protein n=1 Tax=Capsaspora owczarzaki (strain ATCC 30864) TaxID=595528 RepID=A0A0D2X4W8_CAPO3|nr:hypothetical protein CAOG_07054 [Capsaspora owczarzaki ATCC 30864]KJE96784.1 hypothetical protein CAOG_007054 [Capsaspora owczarzaki ATCC 30864]|eukprot:XP_004343778.1 hypothetical protein CAOG_07054 [Capsaspora owczarzaki ATCC 30864]
MSTSSSMTAAAKPAAKRNVQRRRRQHADDANATAAGTTGTGAQQTSSKNNKKRTLANDDEDEDEDDDNDDEEDENDEEEEPKQQGQEQDSVGDWANSRDDNDNEDDGAASDSKDKSGSEHGVDDGAARQSSRADRLAKMDSTWAHDMFDRQGTSGGSGARSSAGAGAGAGAGANGRRSNRGEPRPPRAAAAPASTTEASTTEATPSARSNGNRQRASKPRQPSEGRRQQPASTATPSPSPAAASNNSNNKDANESPASNPTPTTPSTDAGEVVVEARLRAPLQKPVREGRQAYQPPSRRGLTPEELQARHAQQTAAGAIPTAASSEVTEPSKADAAGAGAGGETQSKSQPRSKSDKPRGNRQVPAPSSVAASAAPSTNAAATTTATAKPRQQPHKQQQAASSTAAAKRGDQSSSNARGKASSKVLTPTAAPFVPSTVISHQHDTYSSPSSTAALPSSKDAPASDVRSVPAPRAKATPTVPQGQQHTAPFAQPPQGQSPQQQAQHQQTQQHPQLLPQMLPSPQLLPNGQLPIPQLQSLLPMTPEDIQRQFERIALGGAGAAPGRGGPSQSFVPEPFYPFVPPFSHYPVMYQPMIDQYGQVMGAPPNAIPTSPQIAGGSPVRHRGGVGSPVHQQAPFLGGGAGPVGSGFDANPGSYVYYPDPYYQMMMDHQQPRAQSPQHRFVPPPMAAARGSAALKIQPPTEQHLARSRSQPSSQPPTSQ